MAAEQQKTERQELANQEEVNTHTQHELSPTASPYVPRTRRDRQGLDIPLPRQMLYEGKTPWEAFIHPFEAQALSCGWDTSEKLFRLTNSLRGDAAEFVFCQLTADVVDNYQKLIQALEARFKERRAVTSYLAQLEGRKQQAKETLSEFIADIRRLVVKGYPTAEEETRETIALRHFLKGLSNQQAAIHVGMTSPKTVEDARTALDTYTSLHDQLAKPPKVRSVKPSEEADSFVTHAELKKFGDELKSSVEGQFSELKSLLKEKQGKPTGKAKNGPKQSLASVECYKCRQHGHYARECPAAETLGASTAGASKPVGNC